MQRLSQSGMLATSLLLFAGAAAAGVAWWHNLAQTRHALDFWGPEAAVTIRDAPRVVAYEVSFEQPGEAESAGGGSALVHPRSGIAARVLQERDISQAKGLVHFRHALLDDRSFDWNLAAPPVGDLRYALRFEREESSVVVFLAADFTHLATCPRSDSAPATGDCRTVSTRPIADGLRRYFSDILR